MGINVMKNGVHIFKALIFSIKTCYRVIRCHPSILCLIPPFFLLYKFFPSVFILLLPSFPVFVCTIILLATLIYFGHRTDTSHTEQKQKYPKESDIVKDDFTIDKNRITSEKETNLKNTDDIKQKTVERGSSLTERTNSKGSKRRVTFSPIHHYGSISKTVKSNQPKEIHEDGKLKIDKRIGEITDTHSIDHNEDNAESSGPGQVSKNAESSSSRAFMAGDRSHQVLDSENPVEETDKNVIVEKERRKSVVAWTEDDEKDLMDLGSSEEERNQRLESLMARRRARKKLLRMEKKLIDFNSNDPSLQVAPITIIKNNPFVPVPENEIPGLPPLPGSAPSVLVPRINPFDLPYDPQEERPDLTRDSFQQEFMTVLQKDIFCRHESFCYGSSSYLGGIKQDKSDNHIKPYLVMEDSATAEQRPLSERSDSTSSFVLETEIPPSFAYQQDQNNPIEAKMISHIDYSPNVAEEITQSFEADIAENNCKNTDEVYVKPDIVEEKYSGSSSSSSSESSQNEAQSQNTDGPPLMVEDCDLTSGITVKLEGNNQTHEPLFHSSPSATEKRTIEESLFCVDKDVVLTSVPSIASDLQVEVSEVSSPSSEITTAFTDEELVNPGMNIKSEEDLWAASSELCEVDENESKSKGISEISESDVIGGGLQGDNTNSSNVLHAVPIELQPLIDSSSTSCPLIFEPINEGFMNQYPSSGSEADKHEPVHKLDLEENVEPVASIPLQDGYSTSPPSIDTDKNHEETQEPPAKSSEEGNIINNEEAPVEVDSNSKSSLMSRPTEEGETNQNPSLSAEPETHNHVQEVNIVVNVEPVSSTSSPMQVMVEKSTVNLPTGNEHEQSTKSIEEDNIINNLKDPVQEETNSTLPLTCEPIKGDLMIQNPPSGTEPEKQKEVDQVNMEEVEPIASSSSDTQTVIGKSTDHQYMDSEHHKLSQDSTSEESISKDTKGQIEAEDGKRLTEEIQENAEYQNNMDLSEIGVSSIDHHHHGSKLVETTESEILKQDIEENHLDERTSKHLHEQEATQITPETAIESGTVSSDDHHGHENYNVLEATDSEIHNQASKVNHLENEISKHLDQRVQEVTTETRLEASADSDDRYSVHGRNDLQVPEQTPEVNRLKDETSTNVLEQEIHQEMMESGTLEEGKANQDQVHETEYKHTLEQQVHGVTPETISESDLTSVIHPDHESNNLQQMMVSETQNEALETDKSPENKTTKHLNDEEVHDRRPGTIFESDLSSSGHPDHESTELQQTIESRTQKEDLEADNNIENRTSKHLQNEQEVNQMVESGTQKDAFTATHDLRIKTNADHMDEDEIRVIPETSISYADHGNDNLQQTTESETQKEASEAKQQQHSESFGPLSNTQNTNQMKTGIQDEDFTANHNLVNETPDKHIHAQEDQAKPEMVSETGVSYDHHDDGSNELQQTRETGTQNEAFDTNQHLENQTSELQNNEQEIHQMTDRDTQKEDLEANQHLQSEEEVWLTPKTSSGSGNSFADHHEQGGNKLRQMIIKRQKEAFEAKQQVQDGTPKHLQNEEEVWLTPKTTLGTPKTPMGFRTSFSYHSGQESHKLPHTLESGIQNQILEANQQPDKETSNNLHEQPTPEIMLESTVNLQQTMESGIHQESLAADELDNELASELQIAPEVIIDSGVKSDDPDHGSINFQEKTESMSQDKASDDNHLTSGTSECLHNEPEVHHPTPETTQDSDVGSSDHSDHGIKSTLNSEEIGTGKQAVEPTQLLEKDFSEQMHIQEVNLTPQTTTESRICSKHSDGEIGSLLKVTESGTHDNVNQHLENKISEHHHNQEVGKTPESGNNSSDQSFGKSIEKHNLEVNQNRENESAEHLQEKEVQHTTQTTIQSSVKSSDHSDDGVEILLNVTESGMKKHTSAENLHTGEETTTRLHTQEVGILSDTSSESSTSSSSDSDDRNSEDDRISQHLGNDSSKLLSEKDIQLTPQTTNQSGVSSSDHSDNGMEILLNAVETETEKQAFKGNQHLENESGVNPGDHSDEDIKLLINADESGAKDEETTNLENNTTEHPYNQEVQPTPETTREFSISSSISSNDGIGIDPKMVETGMEKHVLEEKQHLDNETQDREVQIRSQTTIQSDISPSDHDGEDTIPLNATKSGIEKHQNDQQFHNITSQTTTQSGAVSSDHHDDELDTLPKTMESEIKEQVFDTKQNSENESSEAFHDQEAHRLTPETPIQSGASSIHHSNNEDEILIKVKESGTEEQASRVKEHSEDESSKHLHEHDIHKLTPQTRLQPGISSADHHDSGRDELQETALAINKDLDGDPYMHLLDEEVHQVSLLTTAEAGIISTDHSDDGVNQLKTMENETEKLGINQDQETDPYMHITDEEVHHISPPTTVEDGMISTNNSDDGANQLKTTANEAEKLEINQNLETDPCMHILDEEVHRISPPTTVEVGIISTDHSDDGANQLKTTENEAEKLEINQNLETDPYMHLLDEEVHELTPPTTVEVGIISTDHSDDGANQLKTTENEAEKLEINQNLETDPYMHLLDEEVHELTQSTTLQTGITSTDRSDAGVNQLKATENETEKQFLEANQNIESDSYVQLLQEEVHELTPIQTSVISTDHSGDDVNQLKAMESETEGQTLETTQNLESDPYMHILKEEVHELVASADHSDDGNNILKVMEKGPENLVLEANQHLQNEISNQLEN